MGMKVTNSRYSPDMKICIQCCITKQKICFIEKKNIESNNNEPPLFAFVLFIILIIKQANLVDIIILMSLWVIFFIKKQFMYYTKLSVILIKYVF